MTILTNLSPARLPDESWEDYKDRRKVGQKVVKALTTSVTQSTTWPTKRVLPRVKDGKSFKRMMKKMNRANQASLTEEGKYAGLRHSPNGDPITEP